LVEYAAAPSHSLAQEADVLAASVARFRIGGAVAAEPSPAPAPRTIAVLKTVGRGGAARLQEVEDDWQEF